jgi:hypothetical protein
VDATRRNADPKQVPPESFSLWVTRHLPRVLPHIPQLFRNQIFEILASAGAIHQLIRDFGVEMKSWRYPWQIINAETTSTEIRNEVYDSLSLANQKERDLSDMRGFSGWLESLQSRGIQNLPFEQAKLLPVFVIEKYLKPSGALQAMELYERFLRISRTAANFITGDFEYRSRHIASLLLDPRDVVDDDDGGDGKYTQQSIGTDIKGERDVSLAPVYWCPYNPRQDDDACSANPAAFDGDPTQPLCIKTDEKALLESLYDDDMYKGNDDPLMKGLNPIEGAMSLYAADEPVEKNEEPVTKNKKKCALAQMTGDSVGVRRHIIKKIAKNPDTFCRMLVPERWQGILAADHITVVRRVKKRFLQWSHKYLDLSDVEDDINGMLSLGGYCIPFVNGKLNENCLTWIDRGLKDKKAPMTMELIRIIDRIVFKGMLKVLGRKITVKFKHELAVHGIRDEYDRWHHQNKDRDNDGVAMMNVNEMIINSQRYDDFNQDGLEFATETMLESFISTVIHELVHYIQFFGGQKCVSEKSKDYVDIHSDYAKYWTDDHGYYFHGISKMFGASAGPTSISADTIRPDYMDIPPDDSLTADEEFQERAKEAEYHDWYMKRVDLSADPSVAVYGRAPTPRDVLRARQIEIEKERERRRREKEAERERENEAEQIVNM